jgi:hypothetical protein
MPMLALCARAPHCLQHGVQDNCLTELPKSFGALSALHVLDASFNAITALPSTMALGCRRLHVCVATACGLMLSKA